MPGGLDEYQPEAFSRARHSEDTGCLVSPLERFVTEGAEKVDLPRDMRGKHVNLFLKQRHAVTVSHNPQLRFGTYRDHLRPGGDELLVPFVHQPAVHVTGN